MVYCVVCGQHEGHWTGCSEGGTSVRSRLESGSQLNGPGAAETARVPADTPGGVDVDTVPNPSSHDQGAS